MKLIDFAKSHKAELLPPMAEELINAFENVRTLKMPKALRDFYLEAGGTTEFTECIWRIWPFEELETLDRILHKEPCIKLLNQHTGVPELSDYLAFIDVLIEAPLYAVCCNTSNTRYGEVITLGGDSEPFLAGPIASFEEFLSILEEHWEFGVLPDALD